MRTRLAAIKAKLAMWLSKSARVNAELRHVASNQVIEISDLRDRLKLAVEAQQKASEQLIAERALRQAADERAERYHEQLTEALKSNVDWLARGLYHRRPMFGVGAPPDAPQESKPVALPVKRMARGVVRENDQQVNQSLRELLEQIRNGAEEMPVGPEFTTS